MNSPFQYPEVVGDFLRNSQGEITIAFRLDLPPLFSLSGQQYEEVHAGLTKAMTLLPWGHLVHKQDWYVTRQHQAPTESKGSPLSAANAQHFHGRSYQEHSSYLFISRRLLTPEVLVTTCSMFIKQLATVGIRAGRLRHADLAGTETEPGLLQQYAALNLEQRPAGQVQHLTIKSWNQVGLTPHKVYEATTQGIPPVLRVDTPQYRETYSSVAGLQRSPLTDSGSFRTVNLPSGLAAAVGEQLPGNHIFNQYFIPWGTQARDDGNGFFEYVNRILEPSFAQSVLHTLTPWQSAARQREREYYRRLAETARTELNRTELNNGIVRAQFQLIMWPGDSGQPTGSDGHQLQQGCLALQQMGLYAGRFNKGEAQEQPDLSAGIPGNTTQLSIEQTVFMTAQQASSCCILETNTPPRPPRPNPALIDRLVEECKSAGNGFEHVLLAPLHVPVTVGLVNRFSGQPEPVDIATEPERMTFGVGHKMLVGAAGSGRSFLLKHIIREYTEQQVPVLVIDPVYPDAKIPLFEALQGQILTVTPENLPGFNPFLLDVAQPGETEPTREQRLLRHRQHEGLVLLLTCLWELETEQKVEREGKEMLKQTLHGYTEWLSQDQVAEPGFNSFCEFLELHWVNRRDTTVKKSLLDFLSALRPYYRGGAYEGLMNAPQPWQWQQGPALVLLSALRGEEKLVAAVQLLVVDHFNATVVRRTTPRLIVVEGADWYLQRIPVLAEQLLEMVSFFGSQWTQSAAELLVVGQNLQASWGAPHMRALLDKLTFRLIMRLGPFDTREPDWYQWLLSAHEAAQVQSLEMNFCRRYSEVFVKMASYPGKVYRVEVSADEHTLYSARPLRETQAG